MAVERRTLLLGGALVAALIALLVMRSTSDVTSAAANRPAQPARPPASAGAQANALDAAKVNLEELERKRLSPADTGRNPFRFEPKAPPEPPKSPTDPNSKTVMSELPAAPTGPPPPPPISLKFIGLVEKVDGTKIAVLSDGRRPLYGVEGQEIDGRYRILKIGAESIELAYLDGRGRQTIRLTGQ